MSATIYGGKTENGVIIQDMVDNNHDYVYRNKLHDGYFARFTQSILSEDDTECETAAPAIAIFHEENPFDPVWGVRLDGSFDDYTDGFNMHDRFMDELDKLWSTFRPE